VTTAREQTVSVQIHPTAELIMLGIPMPEAHRQWEARHQDVWAEVKKAVR
jgi:hypothetical protein